MTSADPVLSIIMPVYNAAPYVAQALDAALVAEEPIEVVCIDDGSTDGSDEVLRSYAERDARVQMIQQPNAGVSAARNAGLATARGSFVTFLDADDLLADGACKAMLDKLASTGADIVFFSASTTAPVEPGSWLNEHSTLRDASCGGFDPALLIDEHVPPFLHLCCKRALLEDNVIRFDEELPVGEDALFVLETLVCAQGIELMSDRLYIYRNDAPGSLTHGLDYDGPDACALHLDVYRRALDVWFARRSGTQHDAGLVEWGVEYCLYAIMCLSGDERTSLLERYTALLRSSWDEAALQNMPLRAGFRELVHAVLAGEAMGDMRAKKLRFTYMRARKGFSAAIGKAARSLG